MSAKWDEVVEDGRKFWVNEELGTVMQVGDSFVALAPKVIKYGNFDNAEQATKFLENPKVATGLNAIIDEYNEKVVAEFKK